jgi:hypothetical protein
MKRLVIVALLAAVVSGCATSFSGNAKVDGPAECRKVCGKWGMDLVGMVAMGEYTDGCICKVKGEQLSVNDMGKSALLSSAGAAGGAVGVFLQMQDEKKN